MLKGENAQGYVKGNSVRIETSCSKCDHSLSCYVSVGEFCEEAESPL